jgi:hypothetical protein
MSQRSGTKLLTESEQLRVKELLGLPTHPGEPPRGPSGGSAGSGGGRRAWTGENDPTARKQLRVDLTAALGDALARQSAQVEKKATARRLPMSGFHGLARAAKLVVDRAFKEWIDNATVPPETAAARSAFTFTSVQPSPTLLDCTDTQVRAATPQPVTAAGAAEYIATTDEACQKLIKGAALDYKYGTAAEQAFYRDEVMAPFVEEHKRALETYDRFGFLITDPNAGRVFVQPNVVGWKDGESEDVDAVRQKKWTDFLLVVHEYIHVLEHPALPVATLRSDTVREGFCEHLTVEVIRGLQAATNDQLREIGRLVVGAEFFPNVTYFTNYQPAEKYRAFYAATEQALQVITPNGLKAAFFQGHTEFLGLDPRARGEWLSPVRESGAARSQPLPHSYAFGWSLDVLARVTGAPAAELTVGNPAIAGLWAKAEDGLKNQVYLPAGYRTHRVLALGQAPNKTVESWATIAAQNGTTVEVLTRLNPEGHDTPTIADVGDVANDWVLVPDH